MEEKAGVFAIFKEIWGVLKAVGGGILMVIYMPQTVANYITTFMKTLLPDFLQWEISRVPALVIALICAVLAAKYWGTVVGFVSNIVKVIPFIGGFLSLAAMILMYLGLFYAFRAVASSGWLQAIALFLITVAICAPGYRKWIVLAFERSGRIGVWVAKTLFRGGKWLTKTAANQQWSDPIKKALKETLENLRLECGQDDLRFIARSEHIRDLLIEGHPDKAETISEAVRQFAIDKGIMQIDSRPIAQVVEHDMTFSYK